MEAEKTMYGVSSKSMVLSVVVLCTVVMAAFSLSFMLQSCSDSGGGGGLQANAGKDLSVFLGRKVWLDGTHSHQQPDLLTYEWKFIRKPFGSQAALDDPHSSRPGFKPDRPGEFGLELHVTLGSESSIDTVTVTTQYPYAAFLDFDSWAYKGSDTGKASDYGIKLGLMNPDGNPPTPVTYATDFTGSDAGNAPYGFQVWFIDRATGLPESDQPQSYPMFNKDDANAMATALQNIPNGQMAVVSALKRPTPPGESLSSIDTDKQLIPALQLLGASGYLDSLGATTNDTESYSLVGMGAIGKGFGFEAYGYHHGNAPVSISGQLIRNVMDPAPPGSQNPNNYTFSYNYIPFNTRTADNGMSVNGIDYPLPEALPSNSGGFHVLVLQRDTLQTALHKLYLINNNGTADATAMQSMGNDLYGYAISSDYKYGNPYLVFVSSVGSLPNLMESFNNDNNDADKAERALNLLGGTPGVFPALSTTDTYGLLGHGPGNGWPNGNGVVPATQESYMGNYAWVVDPNYPIESVEESSVLNPGIAAELSGLLKKDPLGWYIPFLGDGGGAASGIDYSLIPIAFQAPTSWNGPDNAYEQQVYMDLSRVLLGDWSQTDVRQSYYRTDVTWSEAFSILRTETSCDDLQNDLNYYAGQTDPDLDCTNPDYVAAFNTMRGYLEKEVNDVSNLYAWRSDVHDLLKLINADENGQFATDYENVMNLAQLSSSDKGKTIALRVLGFVQSVISVTSSTIALFALANGETGLPEAGKAATIGSGCGLVSSLIGLACQCVPQKSSTNDVPGELKAEAAQMWSMIQAGYINSTLIFDQAYTFLTTDWGRLNQISQVYDSIYNSTLEGQVISYLEPGINASFYQFLLPVVFHAEPMPYTQNAQDGKCDYNPCYFYVCKEDNGDHVYTEKCKGDKRPSDSYVMIKHLSMTYDTTDCGDDYRYTSFYTVWKSNSDDSNDYYSDKDIKLFQQPTPRDYNLGDGPYAGGLGVSQYTFTSRWPFNYEYPSGKSDTDTYHWGSGCNCSPVTHPCEN